MPKYILTSKQETQVRSAIKRQQKLVKRLEVISSSSATADELRLMTHVRDNVKLLARCLAGELPLPGSVEFARESIELEDARRDLAARTEDHQLRQRQSFLIGLLLHARG